MGEVGEVGKMKLNRFSWQWVDDGEWILGPMIRGLVRDEYGLSTALPTGCSVDRMVALMSRDKKLNGKQIEF